MKKISTLFVVFALVLSTAGAFPVSVRAESDHNNNQSEEHSNDNHNNDNHENNHNDDNHGNEHGNNHDNDNDDNHDDEHGDDDNHNTPVDLCINVDGVQTIVPQGLVANGNQCFPVITTATVVATKVVCNSESDLPNWGKGEAADITATTAADYVAAHPNCHVQSGWQFQWAPDGVGNGIDNLVGPAGSPWTTSDFTNAQGTVSMIVPAASTPTWFREVLPSTDWLGYTGWLGGVVTPADEVTAEMYCESDVLNYDNYEYINPVVAGQTYHCVAFNVLKTVTPPTDVCSNIDGAQATVPTGYHADGTQCLPDAPAPKVCADNQDNDGDTLIDALDPGCHTDGNASNSATYDPNDNDETNSVVIVVDVCANIEGNQSTIPSGKVRSGEDCVDPSGPSNPTDPTGPTGNGGGNGGGSNGPVNFGFVSSGNNGQVLGASCGMYMEKHIRLGSSKNDPEQVKKLQVFLNKWMGSALPVNGIYDQATYNVVKSFQTKYGDDVLKPWGLKESTGLVYLATLRKINKLECPDLTIELPSLVPWSMNPNAQ